MYSSSFFEKKYDIAIIGAGVAGCAAALKARSFGMKTVLIEKQCTLGGLATSGFINIFLPLCDGLGNQVLFGLVEDFLKLSLKYGPFELPPGWGGRSGTKITRYTTKFSPAGFALALEKSLIDSGVDIWFDTVFINADKRKNHISTVNVFNESGIGKIRADYYIDASGSAVLWHSLGLKTDNGSNVPASWSLNASLKQAGDAVKFKEPDFLLNILKLGSKISEKDNEDIQYSGNTGKDITEFLIKERVSIRNYYDSSSSSSQFPIALANMPHLRTIRKIIGIDSVTLYDKQQPNSHYSKILPDWRIAGKLWGLPFNAMIDDKMDNLIAAGRIISSESSDAWEVVRSIPSSIASGELAGLAAVLAIKKNLAVTQIKDSDF
jgi:hypothetical protein